MTHRLISAAAARMGIAPTASSTPAIVVPPAAPTPPAATGGQGDDTVVDVVTVSDAQAMMETARAEGAAAERERTSAVMASDSGKANPTMANWMLQNNPTATAAAIVAQLDTMPKAAAPTPPAPPAAAAAITVPLENTPKIEVSADANNGQNGGATQADIDKLWDQGIAAATASNSNSFGADLAPGVPRTGN